MSIRAPAHAERAAYSFHGEMSGPESQTWSLFGYNVPRNSEISGTFSYDTETPGSEVSTAAQNYHQTIEGGLTLDINDGQVRLTGSQYRITVENDLGTIPSDRFIVDYFNYYIDDRKGIDPSVRPLVVSGDNGTQNWTGIAHIRLVFAWSGDTFPDPDEPKLTADRPLTPDYLITPLVGSASPTSSGVSGKSFATGFGIAAIPPRVGDYNRDGKIDASDQIEWRKAFGQTSLPGLYADGNGDGVVDSLDYLVWRKAAAANGQGGAVAASGVPEPAGLAIAAALTLSGLALRRRNLGTRLMLGRTNHEFHSLLRRA